MYTVSRLIRFWDNAPYEYGYKLKIGCKDTGIAQKHGLTQEQLSELSGVDYKHIQLLESKNASSPKLETIEKIAKAFRITPSELLKF